MQTSKNKQEVILNTALKLYYHRGFNSIGVDRIIIESKVAKMTYYKYFPAKVNIYEACLNQEILMIKTGLINAIESIPNKNHLDQIGIVIDWFYTRSNIVGYNGMLYQKAKVELINSSCILIIENYYIWLSKTLSDLLFKADISNHKQKTNFIINLIDGILQAPYLVDINELKVTLFTFLKS